MIVLAHSNEQVLNEQAGTGGARHEVAIFEYIFVAGDDALDVIFPINRGIRDREAAGNDDVMGGGNLIAVRVGDFRVISNEEVNRTRVVGAVIRDFDGSLAFVEEDNLAIDFGAITLGDFRFAIVIRRRGDALEVLVFRIAF